MKIFLLGLLGSAALAVSTGAAEAGPRLPTPPVPDLAKMAESPPSGKSAASHFSFSLLPKSLQKNPELELTVVTEMTEEGKKLPPVSPQQPAYYILHASGFHEYGDTTDPARPMTGAELQGVLQGSLAANGYLPVPSGPVRPTLLIIYTWGAYNGGTSEPVFGDRRAFMDRAVLVGGQKFAHQMADVFNQVDNLKAAAIPTWVFLFVNEFHQYTLTDPKHAFLVDQSSLELYYVVASAYDYAAATANQRRLLWRTRMTVGSAGLSLTQSLPPLITSAAPFFGKDMSEPAILVRRVREGKVEVGSPAVVTPPQP
jgi:hypothetical protein